MSDATIIAGKLKDDALRSSIANLVKYVDDSVNGMAERFNTALGSMSQAMKDFAVSNGASVQVMKQAWRDMAATFDGLAAVQTAKASGSGKSAADKVAEDAEKGAEAVKKEGDALKQLGEEQQAVGANWQKVFGMPEGTEKQITAKLNAVKELKRDVDITTDAHKQLTAEYERLKQVQADLEGRTVRRRQVAVEAAMEEVNALKQVEAQMGRIPSEMRMPDMAKSARDSYAVFFKAASEETKELELLIKMAEERLASSPLSKFSSQTLAQLSQVDNSIEQTKAKIDQLYEAEKRLHDDASDRFGRVYKAYRQMLDVQRPALMGKGDMAGVADLDVRIEKAERILRNYFGYMATGLEHAREQANALNAALAQGGKARSPQYFREYSDLAEAIAKVLKVQRDEIIMADEETASRRRLQATLKQLKLAYDNLSAADRKSQNGQALLATIRSYEDAVKRLNMAQKTDIAKMDVKNVLGMDVRTLDEITYKMQLLQQYRSSFSVVDRDQVQQIQAINRELERLKALQQTAGQMKFGEIMMIPESTIDNINRKVRELEQHKIHLSTTDDIDRIQQINKEIDRLNQKKNSLDKGKGLTLEDIIKIQPRTLDEMARKIQQLQQFRGTIDVTKDGAADKLRQVNEEMENTKKKMDEIMGKNKQVQAEDEKTRNGVLRSWNYIRNRLAYMLTVGASISFAKNVIEIRSQYQMLERSIGTLVDSARQGSEIFSELNEMALKSPFTLLELGGAAKQLTAYDIAAKDVVDTTRRLGDLAAAAGINIDRLTYSLGHIKSFGYLNSRDARMWATAGIPLVKELADHFSELEGRVVSMADVYDRIKKHAVDFNDVMAVTNRMTDEGGKYFNFQEKVAGSLKVQLANLNLAWNNMLNDIGKSNQGIIYWFINAIKSLVAGWRTLNKVVYGLLGYLTLMKVIVPIFQVWMMMLKRTTIETDALTAAQKRMYGAMTGIKKMFSTIFSPLGAIGVGIAALTIFGTEAMQAAAHASEIGKSFKDSISEDLDSIKRFGKEYGETLMKARSGVLDSAEGQKAWERMREEIEKTSAVGAGYATKLENGQSDVNKRIEEGMQFLQTTRDILSDIDGSLDWEKIPVTEDWLLGLAGEGLGEDLEDYSEKLDDVNETIRQTGANFEWLFLSVMDREGREAMDRLKKERDLLQGDLDAGIKHSDIIDAESAAIGLWRERKEANEEISDSFAKVKQRILDTAKVYKTEEERLRVLTELMERYKRAVMVNDPKISGWAKDLFESQIEGITADLAKQLKVSYDANTRNWKIMMESLGAVSGDFFKDWSAEEVAQFDWASEEGQKFITEALDKIKREHIPDVYYAIQKMVADANNLKIFIPVYWQVIGNPLTAMQQRFNDYFQNDKGTQDALRKDAWDALKEGKMKDAWGMFMDSFKGDAKAASAAFDEAQKKFAFLAPKTTEGYVEYEKRLQDEYEKTTNSLEVLQRTRKKETDTERQKALDEDIAHHQQEKEAIMEVANAWGLKYEREKKSSHSGRKGEDIVNEALRMELSILKEVQSNYDKMRKAGVDDFNAIKLATQGYGDSLAKINGTLGKFGIAPFDLADFAGKDVRQVLDKLKKQRDDLLASGKVKLQSIKELDVEIQRLEVDAKTYDMKKLVDGLNNELGKLEEQYAISLELDADPELNDMLTDMLGIGTEALPRTFTEYMTKAKREIDRMIQGMGKDPYRFDIMSTDLPEWAKRNQIDMDSDQMKSLEQWQKKFRDAFKKNLADTEKNLDDYVKKYGNLSDKIAEIEAERLQKIKKLNNTYYNDELRSRPEYLAKLNAINKGAEREIGAATFDDFKNTPLYVRMFEDLGYASTSALEAMRKKLKEVKDGLGELTPEQMKTVVQQMEKIDEELIRRNPFKGLLKNARNYTKAIGKEGKRAQEAFVKVQKEYSMQQDTVTLMKQQLEQVKARVPWDKQTISQISEQLDIEEALLAKLKEILDAAEQEVGKFDMWTKVFKKNADAIAGWTNPVAANLQSLGELRDYLHDTFGVELPAELDGVIDGLTGVGEGISKITSSAQSGDVVGVVTGVVKTVTGIGEAISSAFGGGGARTKKLNRAIKDSQEQVRKLQMAYKELERQVDKAMGAEEIRARRAAIANKQAELAELERQLALEKAKRKKDRDEEAIKQYEEEIQELRNEIKDMAEDIASTLLGSDIKSAAEDFVNTWVDAWKAGEDTLEALESRFDEMIDNMIMKAVASKIVANRLQKVFDLIDKYTSEGSEGGEDLVLNEIRSIQDMEAAVINAIDKDLKELYGEKLGIAFGSGGDANLSALQQGIQGITEDTAGALEAYMNGVSQQVYYQSDILTQIRDKVAGMDTDVSLATQSQMLLQMQQSYQVVMTIQGLLAGWSSPNGMAVRVEMV